MSEPSQPTPPSGPEAPGAPVPPTEPPAPPAPPVPPVPQYGEYAPAGYVPPQPAPGFEAAAAAAQPYATQPYAGQAYPGQPFGAASFPAQPGVKTRKTWDLVLTVVLIVVGFFGMLIGAGYGALFSDPTFMDEMFRSAGVPGFQGTVGAAPAVLVISHVLLYLIALGGAIPLLITKRIAFWVPLAAGVLAAIIFWVALFAVFLSDPGFVAQYS